ncbi:zinc ABC transporter substrate-binding protein [Paenarthrobacter sp. PH39-S1]|uniref:metal ABC transporter solute-binding protein, Zn/Mn family n=1 Tax=Paenarthrobacter sp. PH39-S1 TaxID=3046204 RepID=UPI0024B960BF|nr:zinc ABC transporter substrate-binding protein [Paenarthrobacter sp. PH39-S1]MDJ0356284.1 zinc ABC transporter substrate-binding protein [Paenarthrobacter sp. PH39-S1]
MNRKLIAVPLLAVATVLTLVGCSSADAQRTAASGTINVVASTDVWGSIAQTIGGDHVAVTSIIDDPAKDPHQYEANAQNQLALSKADVIVENGGGYDDFVNTMITAARNESAVRLNAVDISGRQASANGALNEHVWYDFATVQKVIDQIEGAYSKVDAKDAAVFAGNADALKGRIAAMEQQEADLKTKYTGVGASITEPVPLYMLDAIGLENKTSVEFSKAVEEDTDVAPSVLQETLALYSGHAVKLLAYNEQAPGAQAEAVLTAAKDNGIAVVPVTETLPEGKDYVGWMSDTLNAISAALAQ